MRDSFRLSQGNPITQWLFFVWIARTYNEMRFAPLHPTAYEIIGHVIHSIAGDPRRHQFVEESTIYNPFTSREGEAITRLRELTSIVNTHRLPPDTKDAYMVPQMFEQSPEEILDDMLAHMFQSDYENLVVEGAREREASAISMPDTDSYLSHVCHYLIPEGHVYFSHEIPPTAIFQNLCSQLLPRLQLLVRGDYKSLTLSKAQCKKLLTMLKAIVKVHNKRHKDVSVNLRKLKKK